jgi:hypothetical protein
MRFVLGAALLAAFLTFVRAADRLSINTPCVSICLANAINIVPNFAYAVLQSYNANPLCYRGLAVKVGSTLPRFLQVWPDARCIGPYTIRSFFLVLSVAIHSLIDPALVYKLEVSSFSARVD